MTTAISSAAASKATPVEHVENQEDRGPDKLEHAAQATNVRSVAFAEALALENARPFRKSFLRLYLCLLVAYMCSSTNGFDANTFGEPVPVPPPLNQRPPEITEICH